MKYFMMMNSSQTIVTTGDKLYLEPEPAPLWAKAIAEVTRRMPFGRYTVIAWLHRFHRKPFVARMPQELGGYKFHCSLDDYFESNIASIVFFGGSYEAQESAFARAVLRPGMSFVDVGANWGFFTLMAAHLVGALGRIVALEPDPRAFLKLKANVERNHLDQIQIFELAAADSNEKLTLASRNETVFSRIVQSASAATDSFVIPSQPLDSLLDRVGLDAVDLVKIDVEGAEDMVLAGMEAGLKRHRYRNMILELHPSQLAERNCTIREVVSVLIGEGYKGFGLDHYPVASRRAIYHPRLHVREFIQPLEEALAFPIPHTVWLSPAEAQLF